jgi:hypothetical protein
VSQDLVRNPSAQTVPEPLLGGQLQLFAVVVRLLPASAEAAQDLLQPLLDDFLFAPSTALRRYHQTGELTQPPPSRCTTPASRKAATSAVISLARTRPALHAQTVARLVELHFSDPAQ